MSAKQQNAVIMLICTSNISDISNIIHSSSYLNECISSTSQTLCELIFNTDEQTHFNINHKLKDEGLNEGIDNKIVHTEKEIVLLNLKEEKLSVGTTLDEKHQNAIRGMSY